MSKARTLADLGEGIQSSDLPDITADKLDVGQIGGRRNLIINGAMQVAQRGTSATAAGYLLDRWKLEIANTDQFAFTMSQSPTAPSGFSSSLKIDTTTAETALDTDEYIRLLHRIEAQDLQQLGYGTADAQSVTLSFWARSNLTTAFAVALYAEDNGRIIGSTFTPSAADTWEQFSITFAGDTSGTINNDTGSGLSLEIYLAAGSLWTGTDNTSWSAFANGKLANGIVSNIGSSDSNDFYITGVQLEVGTVATPFEHRSYGEELALCQRYYQYYDATERLPAWVASANTGVIFTGNCLQNPMRAQPSVSLTDPAGFDSYYRSSYVQSSANVSRNSGSTRSVILTLGNFSGMISQDNGGIYNTVIKIDAEL